MRSDEIIHLSMDEERGDEGFTHVVLRRQFVDVELTEGSDPRPA